MANHPLRFDILELERKNQAWPGGHAFFVPMNDCLNSTHIGQPAGTCDSVGTNRRTIKRTGARSEGAQSFRVLCERVGTTQSNTKRTGELSEAAFLLKAESLGFHIAKPWGDSEPYDFILDSGHRRWRVQLKCTQVLRARGYDIQPASASYGKGKIAYTADDIDVLVAHIVPVDTWYVLPVEVFAPRKSLRFYPGIECKSARWEKYREAWDLLRTTERISQNAATLAALDAAYRPECAERDWRRCLLHIAREIFREPPPSIDDRDTESRRIS